LLFFFLLVLVMAVRGVAGPGFAPLGHVGVAGPLARVVVLFTLGFARPVRPVEVSLPAAALDELFVAVVPVVPRRLEHGGVAFAVPLLIGAVRHQLLLLFLFFLDLLDLLGRRLLTELLLEAGERARAQVLEALLDLGSEAVLRDL